MDKRPDIELSIVMPCLNEAETLAVCIKKAQTALAQSNVRAEIIIADNGSEDGSQEIARGLGARVVAVAAKGYGNALMGGIEASHGRYIIMGDADDSYDFLEIPKFLEKLREGYDLVQGCRLPAGGGKVLPGAMPGLHRWLGNPFFSWLARRWFKTPIHDIYCGMRGFSRKAYDSWSLRCVGMEFATEMIIKSSLYRNRIAEVPITLHPDGRQTRRPHLKTFRDGWRTLRFFMISCPRWLFLLPGALFMLIGGVGYMAGLFNLSLGEIKFDIHTLLFSSLFIILGYQSVLFAAFTLIFAINERFLPSDPRVEWLCRKITMERGLFVGAGVFLGGLVLLVNAALTWHQARYGALDYQVTMRTVIPGVTMAAIGFQTVLSGAFMSILGMRRR
ncbi:MAG TPA: glycosyltransferase family 2 protein [Kiritimatiellia bacterium]|nr:glycosyltransferase family 2 protein [Kiritimatiellia bacterium]